MIQFIKNNPDIFVFPNEKLLQILNKLEIEYESCLKNKKIENFSLEKQKWYKRYLKARLFKKYKKDIFFACNFSIYDFY